MTNLSLNLSEAQARALSRQERSYIARKTRGGTWCVWCKASDHHVEFDPTSIERAIKRVQIPAYSDAWMQGDRFGEVLKVTTRTVKVPAGDRAICPAVDEIAHVRLDVSGRVRRYLLADCQEV